MERSLCITTILRDSDLLYTVLAFLHSSTEPLGLISQHLAGVERGGRGFFSLALYYRHSSSLPPWMEFASHRAHGVGAWFGLVSGRFLSSLLFFSSCDTRLRARNDPYLPSGSVFVHNPIFSSLLSFLFSVLLVIDWWFFGWRSPMARVRPSGIGRGRERAQA